jgi:uncharacterized protein YjeT (DUF2065 family)
MSVQILQAVALVLVIEGILPFLSPAFWRQGMLLGVILLYAVS